MTEDDLDNPEWTVEDIAKAKRIDDSDSELASNIHSDLAERDAQAMLPEEGNGEQAEAVRQ